MTKVDKPNSFRNGPDERGHFGIFGGRFVAETLMPLVLALEQAYAKAKDYPEFHRELDGLLTHYVGRPSPLYFAERLTAHFGGAKIYFKREELNHTGARGVDVSSGVESVPGVKDIAKIAAFVAAARAAFSRAAHGNHSARREAQPGRVA